MVQSQFDEKSDADLEEIRKSLQSKTPAVREHAAATLELMDAADLVRLCRAERTARGKRRRMVFVGILAYIAISVLLALLTHGVRTFFYIGVFPGVIASLMAYSNTHKQAAMALAKFDDVEGVGALVEALDIQEPEVQCAINPTLARLLPRLRASEAGLLNNEQRESLRAFLGTRPTNKATKTGTTEVVVAALQALRQVGDESFIEPVAALAEARGYGVDSEVRDAAKDCLEYLYRAKENARISRDLLRASTAVPPAKEGLLRPAEGHGTIVSSELLRPGADSLERGPDASENGFFACQNTDERSIAREWHQPDGGTITAMELLSPMMRSDFPHLLRCLRSRDSKIRESAIVRVRALQPGELLVLARMETQHCQIGRLGGISKWLLVQTAILGGILLFLGALFSLGVDGSGCSGGELPFTTPPDGGRVSEELHLICQYLASTSAPRSVPELLEAMSLSPFMHNALLPRVTSLLPEVRPGDLPHWQAAHFRLLHRLLATALPASSKVLALASIHAVEQVGGSESILPIYRLTFNTDEKVRRSAERCRVALQRRAVTARQQHELMRASVQPGVGADELLRAAAPATTAAPEDLLRAVEAGEHTDPTDLRRPNSGDRELIVSKHL